jgi:four helix bundle protein
LARVLAKKIFELYSNSPAFSKDFKLRDQTKGSSGSIMDNIAEGFGRGNRNEFINSLSYSLGSVGEVKSPLYRAIDRKYITEAVFNEVYALTDQVGAKIGSFINYLNKSNFRGFKFKDRVPTLKTE